MLESLFQSSSLPVVEQVVNFTEARHGVLAGNVANLDTPFFRGVYGDVFVDTYLTMLGHEVSVDERQVTPWERERYQDVM